MGSGLSSCLGLRGWMWSDLAFSKRLGIFKRDGRAWLLGSREHSGVPERVGLCMLEVEECRPLVPLRDTFFSVDRIWWDLCFRVCLQKTCVHKR